MKKTFTSSERDGSDFFKTPVGMHWVGPDGTILHSNQFELDMLGYSCEELTGKNLADLHVNKLLVKEILQKVSLGEKIDRHKTGLFCKDGSVKVVVIQSEAYRENGEYKYTRFFIRDMDKRNDLSNAFLAAIIDGSTDAIISKDLDGIITSWNCSAECLFGYTAREAIGSSVTMLFPQERMEEESKILTRIKKGKRIEHFETVRLHKNGSRLDVSLTISPIRHTSGRIVGASKIARDISRSKKAEKELKAMNKELRDRTASLLSYQNQLRSLASKLSKAEEQERQRIATELHDNLGQILTMSKLKLDLMRKHQNPDDFLSDTDDLQDLINEAIKYTRDLMTDLKPPPALDQEHLGSAVEWLANKMERHDLEVQIEDDGLDKPMDEDVRTVLIQSVRELLFNVVKHAGVDEVQVTLSRREQNVQIEVTDRGKGFDISRRNPMPAEDGGFGLFNIKERMDLLGGDLMIHSVPGEGTVAKLIAPLSRENDQIGNPAYAGPGLNGDPGDPEPSIEDRKEKIKVLLVDDHEMMRKGIRRLIEGEKDLRVIAEASNGHQAVDLVQKTSPDIVVMDVDMPGMNGIVATKKILAKQPHISVIGLSLHDCEDVERSMKYAGASVYLSKNEAFETLCATIRSEAISRE